jgi:hypothetical protein
VANEHFDGPLTRREYRAEHTAIWRELGRLKEILEGPPHPGLEKRMDDYLAESKAIEKQNDKRHASNRWRLDAIIALFAGLAAWLIFFKH